MPEILSVPPTGHAAADRAAGAGPDATGIGRFSG